MDKLDETKPNILGIPIKTEHSMQNELKEMEKKFKKKERESADGYVVVGEKEFTYKKVKYLIKILRYYSLNDSPLGKKGFRPMMKSRKSDMHAVVEYPEETKELVNDYGEISGNYSEFLYHDTLHSWNDEQTIEEQIESCHGLAQSDIDGIPEMIWDKEVKLKEFKEKYPKLMKFYPGKE